MATDGYEDVGSRQRGVSMGVISVGTPFWGDYPEIYDTVVLAGLSLPGLCSIKGKGYELRRKHSKAVGKHGVTTTVIANEPAEFVICVMMTTDEHLRAFESLVPLFKPAAKPAATTGKGSKTQTFTHAAFGQASKAATGAAAKGTTDKSQPGFLSVSHPLLALFRISHCRIIKVSIPEQVEDKGMWKSEIHCIEEVLEGSRKAKTGKTGPTIASTKGTYDSTIGRTPEATPATTNAGPPK